MGKDLLFLTSSDKDYQTCEPEYDTECLVIVNLW